MFISIKGWAHSLSHNFLLIPVAKLSTSHSLGKIVMACGKPIWVDWFVAPVKVYCTLGAAPSPNPAASQAVVEPDKQALSQDSGNDKQADMREKERVDNYSHLGGKRPDQILPVESPKHMKLSKQICPDVPKAYRCHLRQIKKCG